MIQLCRHILTDGRVCQQAAVGGMHYCRHHGGVKKAVARVKEPAAYGAAQPIEFVYPEDRAAIQLNLFLVLEALNNRKIDNTTANTMNRLLNSCAASLAKGALVETDKEHAVQRVILTPEGDEIALPREALEAGENAPQHNQDCPCQRCAEQFRNAPAEVHHAECACGLCAPPSVQRSAVSVQRGQATGIGDDAFDRAIDPMIREAPGRNLFTMELAGGPANKKAAIYEYLYGDVYRKHEAEQAARAKAARDAGAEPPAYEPFDPGKVESEATKRFREAREQVEKNRELALESWKRCFPDEPIGETRALSWNEQEDLRVAQMKRTAGEMAGEAVGYAPLA